MGLEAHRILDHGWIGPYVTISAGFPSGSLYFIALVIGVLGDSVFSVRLGMALLGIATVPVAYVAFRQAVTWRIALMASLLLAVSDWHVHLSRVAYLVIAWPFMEVIALGFLLAGFRTGRWYYYAACGVAIGFSWYAYNAALLFPAGLTVLLALRLVTAPRLRRLREIVLYAVLALAALFAAWPMLDYVFDEKNNYWSHHRAVSVTKTPAYKELDSRAEKGEFYAERMRDYFKWIAWKPAPDAADGLGVKPPIDAVTAALAVAGAAIALWRWRQPLYALSLIMLPVMAMGSVMTFDGIYRRTFGIVPFVMLLAGTTLGLLWEHADRLPPLRRTAALALIAVLVGLIVYRNIDLYFDTFQESRLHRTVYFPEVTSLSEELAKLPDGTYLYFLSLRAQRGNEIRRFLAPDLDEGTDRSREFGTFSLAVDRPPPFVFAFMDAYLETYPRVLARYPGGVFKEERDKYGLLYRTYYFPAGSTVRGDGISIGPTRVIDSVPASPQLPDGIPPPPAVLSCVQADKRQTPLTYYRYKPAEATYAVFRKTTFTGSDLMAIWHVTPAGTHEIACAATGSMAAERREADMPELGLTAETGNIYYIGVASDRATAGGADPAGLRIWEQER